MNERREIESASIIYQCNEIVSENRRITDVECHVTRRWVVLQYNPYGGTYGRYQKTVVIGGVETFLYLLPGESDPNWQSFIGN